MLYNSKGGHNRCGARDAALCLMFVSITAIGMNTYLLLNRTPKRLSWNKVVNLNITNHTINFNITLDDFTSLRTEAEKDFFRFIKSTKLNVVVTEGTAYHLWKSERLPPNTDFDLFSFDTVKLCSIIRGDFREPNELNGFECAIDFMSVHPLREDEINVLNKIGLCSCFDVLCPCDMERYLMWRYGPSMKCSFLSAKSFLGYRESEFDLDKLRDIRDHTYKHFAKPFIDEMTFNRPSCVKDNPEIEMFIDCVISWLHGENDRSICFEPFNFTQP